MGQALIIVPGPEANHTASKNRTTDARTILSRGVVSP